MRNERRESEEEEQQGRRERKGRKAKGREDCRKRKKELVMKGENKDMKNSRRWRERGKDGMKREKSEMRKIKGK